jgi:hypothetical protein
MMGYSPRPLRPIQTAVDESQRLDGITVGLTLLGLLGGSWAVLEIFEHCPFLPSPAPVIRKIHRALAPNIGAGAITAAVVGRP